MEKRKDLEVTIVNEIGEKEVVKLYVIRPTNNIIKGAERYRAKVWNQCLTDGVLTKQELKVMLRERGIWTEEKENEQTAIGKELSDIEKELFVGTDGKKKATLNEGKALAIKMRRLRIKLRDLISEKLAMEENTAESLSENAKFDYFVAECTFYSNGEKVYKNVEDYNEKSADELAFAAASELASMLYSIDSKFEETLPENKWLKTYSLVNDELSLVDKENNLVDTEGRRIDKDGFYLDEAGRRIDRDGNLLEADGTYVIQVEYEDPDEEKETKVVKSKRKSTTESSG